MAVGCLQVWRTHTIQCFRNIMSILEPWPSFLLWASSWTVLVTADLDASTRKGPDSYAIAMHQACADSSCTAPVTADLGFKLYSTCSCRFGRKYQQRTRFLCDHDASGMCKPCIHRNHEEVTKGRVKTPQGWQARSFLPNPYPHPLVIFWLQCILRALVLKLS